MFNGIKTSFKLSNTYKVNTIIYSLKQIPIVKKIIPNTLYQNSGLKTLGQIISLFITIIGGLLAKFLYVVLLIYGGTEMIEKNPPNTFIHIFVFLTIIGAFINTNFFNPTKDKYYAIILLKMEAKKYALSTYIMFLAKNFIFLLPFSIIFGLISKVNTFITILMPIFVILVKIMYTAIVVKINKNYRKLNENKLPPLMWLIIVILLCLAYLLPFINITINSTIFITLFIFSLILGTVSIKYLMNYNNYNKLYKGILAPDNVIFNVQNFTNETSKTTYLNYVEDNGKVSDKKGYEYFNEVFIERHKKILTSSAKKITFVIFIIVLVMIAVCLIDTKLNDNINKMLLTFLPYFLFIMFLINRGQVITSAMFMNCDHSMLSYRFYRQPSVILNLFTKRLKTLIKINLGPALVIAISLPLLLFISGGTNNVMNYFLLFTSIISMMVFFSVHYLFIYYILQPYNIDSEMKSTMYGIVNYVTYFVCYFMINVKLPTLIFGSFITVFCILYIIIALFIVYKYAAKTFKLKN